MRTKAIDWEVEADKYCRPPVRQRPKVYRRDLGGPLDLFMRAGGLGGTSQKKTRVPIWSPETWEHNPPKVCGVFACPAGFFSDSLLAATMVPSKRNNKAFFLRDEDGRQLQSSGNVRWDDETGRIGWVSPLVERVLRRRDIARSRLRSSVDTGFILVLQRLKTFTHTGLVWHHLGEHLDQDEVLDVGGPHWVLTTHQMWVKALRRRVHADRRDEHAVPELDLGPVRRTARWADCKHFPMANPYREGQGRLRLELLEVYLQGVK